MSARSEQIVLDYLSRAADAAHGTLRSDERMRFVARLRVSIEEQRRAVGAVEPADVRRVLAGFGEPKVLVERERRRLDGAKAADSEASGTGATGAATHGSAGPGSAGPGSAGPGSAGLGWAGEARSGPGGRGPGMAEHGHLEQGFRTEVSLAHGPPSPTVSRPGTRDPGTRDPGAGDPGAGDPGAAGRGAAGRGTAGGGSAGRGTTGRGAAGPGFRTQGAAGPPASRSRTRGQSWAEPGRRAQGVGGPPESMSASPDAFRQDGAGGPRAIPPARPEPGRERPAQAHPALRPEQADGSHGPVPVGGPHARAGPKVAFEPISVIRRFPRELLSLVLLGLGGLLLPFPLWPIGALIAVTSRVWSAGDKFVGLVGPLAVTAAGVGVIGALNKNPSIPVDLHAYVAAAHADASLIMRIGAALGAAYLAARLPRRGRPTPARRSADRRRDLLRGR